MGYEVNGVRYAANALIRGTVYRTPYTTHLPSPKSLHLIV